MLFYREGKEWVKARVRELVLGVTSSRCEFVRSSVREFVLSRAVRAVGFSPRASGKWEAPQVPNLLWMHPLHVLVLSCGQVVSRLWFQVLDFEF